MPSFIVNSVLNFLAFLAYFFGKRHRRIIRANLNLAFGEGMSEGEKQGITKQCYKNMVYNLADFIKNQGISKEELEKKIVFKNKEILEDAIEKGEKIIIMTAHYGNWELLIALGAFFKPTSAVGRALDSKSFDKILSQNRKQFDMDLIEKQGAARGMLKALKDGRMLVVLVDQNTREKEGILIDFFGKKARHTPSVANLSRKTDALIVPVFATTEDHQKYTVTFYEPFKTEVTEDRKEDIQRSVQKQADITERVIRQKPDEWFWFHKRWKNQYEHIYK